MPVLAPPSIRMPLRARLRTAGEFLDWLQPKVYADLIGGQRFMHSPVNFHHSQQLSFVQMILALYVERRQLGQIDRENIAVELGPRDVFMPDLCYFTKEQVTRLLPSHAQFAPTLVVEALSPRTARRDLGPKFAAYERYGVQEYWILDPVNLDHRFFAREGELLIEFDIDEDRVNSRVIPGFFLRRTWLNPAALPRVEDCLREIVGG